MMYWKTSFDGDNRNDKKDFNTKMNYVIIAVKLPVCRQRQANDPFSVFFVLQIVNNQSWQIFRL